MDLLNRLPTNKTQDNGIFNLDAELCHSFSTKRLRLRPLEILDKEVYQEIFTDSDVTRYTGGIFTLDKIQTNINFCLKANQAVPIIYLTLTVELKDKNEPIGFVSLNWHRHQSIFAEFGVMFKQFHQSKGYCNELVPALMKHCFDHYELDLLCSYTLNNNRTAQHILKTHGFKLSDNKVFENYLPNAKFWQLSRYEWLNARHKLT